MGIFLEYVKNRTRHYPRVLALDFFCDRVGGEGVDAPAVVVFISVTLARDRGRTIPPDGHTRHRFRTST